MEFERDEAGVILAFRVRDYRIRAVLEQALVLRLEGDEEGRTEPQFAQCVLAPMQALDLASALIDCALKTLQPSMALEAFRTPPTGPLH